MSRRTTALAIAIGGYAAWYYTRTLPDTSGVTFSVSNAELTVRFSRPNPEPADLTSYLVSDDRPGGTDRRAEVVTMLAARLRQVEASGLPTADKARLTASLADAFLRAVGVDVIDKRLEALHAVILGRKEARP